MIETLKVSDEQCGEARTIAPQKWCNERKWCESGKEDHEDGEGEETKKDAIEEVSGEWKQEDDEALKTWVRLHFKGSASGLG